MRVSNCQPHICSPAAANDFRQACAKAETDPGRRKAQLVQLRLSYTEEDVKPRLIVASVMKQFSSESSDQSSIHHEMPLRSSSSILFLDKSLCISLEELERRRTDRPAVYRSTLFIPLGVSSARRCRTENKPPKTNEGYRRVREARLVSFECNDRVSGSSDYKDSLSKHWGCKVGQTAPTHGVNSKADDSDMQLHGSALGLMSLRGSSNTIPGRLKENADEAVCSARSNFEQVRNTFNTCTVDSEMRSAYSGAGKKEDFSTGLEPVLVPVNTCHFHSRGKTESANNTSMTLSLKEALELFRPDFISRSQGRLRSLKQRAWRRRALQSSTPDLLQCLRENQSFQRSNCTTPDPLSDNLFKPRERSISGREMQLRSRRIYNKLPEVTKKKEEEKRRAVSQTNRQRAQVFKKRLLDQILQR